MSNLFYNIEANQAFSVESEFSGKSWVREVNLSTGRAKLHGHSKRWMMPTAELSNLIDSGKVVKLQNSKTISRDIQYIRAGIKPPEPVKAKKTKRSDFRMKVGSLIDPIPNDYVGIFNADGNLIGHEYNGSQFLHEAKAEELIKEVKNENQLSIF